MSPLEEVVANSRRLACSTKRQYRSVILDFVECAGSDATCWTPATCDTWVQQLMRSRPRRHATGSEIGFTRCALETNTMSFPA